MRRGHADRLVEHDPAVDVSLVAPRLALLLLWLVAAAAPHISQMIFFRAMRISILLVERVVCGGHDHRATPPDLANLMRALCVPHAFAAIDLFVPPSAELFLVWRGIVALSKSSCPRSSRASMSFSLNQVRRGWPGQARPRRRFFSYKTSLL